MSSKINYNSGEKIGECIFISEILQTDDAKNFRRQAIFECSCGKHFESRISHVKSKWTKSCGCLQTTYKEKPIFRKEGNPLLMSLYTKYIHGAGKRDLEFNLTLKEFEILTKQNCFYCNSEPIKELSYQRNE